MKKVIIILLTSTLLTMQAAQKPVPYVLQSKVSHLIEQLDKATTIDTALTNEAQDLIQRLTPYDANMEIQRIQKRLNNKAHQTIATNSSEIVKNNKKNIETVNSNALRPMPPILLRKYRKALDQVAKSSEANKTEVLDTIQHLQEINAKFEANILKAHLRIKDRSIFQANKADAEIISRGLSSYNIKVINPKLNKQLNSAIFKNNIHFIRKLFANDVVPSVNLLIDPPLMLATHTGTKEIIVELVRYGAIVNGYDSLGHTALTNASRNGQNAIVTELVRLGADVNRGDSLKVSPLMKATQNNQVETISLLVSLGANIHAEDSSGYTALDYAISMGNTNAASKLIELGADGKKTLLKYAGYPLPSIDNLAAIKTILHAGVILDEDFWKLANANEAIMEIVKEYNDEIESECKELRQHTQQTLQNALPEMGNSSRNMAEIISEYAKKMNAKEN